MDSKSFFKIFVAFSFLFLVFSCSESKPQIYNIFSRIVYDSDTTDDSLKLSVYAQITSEPKRIKKISIVHQDSGLIWETDDVNTLYSEDKKQQFIGYSAFLPSYKHGFPKGKYSFLAEDMLQNVVSANFTIKESVDDATVSDIKIQENPYYIAIYDENDIILYAGKLRDSVSSDREIKNNYKSAKYYRNIQLTNDVMILHEKQFLY